MRNSSTLCRNLASLLFAGAVASAAFTLPADGQSSPPSTLVDMKFDGGNVAEYVEALRQACPDANILCDAEAREVPIEPVELRGTTLTAAVELLDEMLVEKDSHAVHLRSRVIPSQSDAQPIYHVVAHVLDHGGMTAPMESKVWTVASLISPDIAAEDILTAIETAIALQPSPEKTQIRFHEETGLIIARAQLSHIIIINDVIDQLTTGHDRRGAGANDRQAMGAALELQKREVRVQMLEAEITRLRDSIAELESQYRTHIQQLERKLTAAEALIAERDRSGGDE